MFTKRLSWPGALNSRASMPAALPLRASRASATVAPVVSTVSAPLVKLRRGEGMRTLTDMVVAPGNTSRFVWGRFVGGKPLFAAQSGLDGGQLGVDGVAGGELVLDGF